MRIVLATPLYPPDTAEPAPYIKELARRLSKKHEVVIVAYGRLPETVEGVRIVTVDKRQPLPIRLARYLFALLSNVRDSDVVLFENGPSVELPVALIERLVRTPFVFHIGDRRAYERSQKSFLLRTLTSLASSGATSTLRDLPATRPEILPFREAPTKDLQDHERSWEGHLTLLERALPHD